MEFMEVVAARRSIRKYQPTPVEPEKINKVLEAARLAPSWKNGQCWRFIVVTSEETRTAITACLPEGNVGAKANLQAPVTIVLCFDPAESDVYDGKDYAMLDVGIAMEHLVLAAADEGLGTNWQGLLSEDQMRQVLGIPDNIRVAAISPLGYPDQAPRQRPRKTIQEIVFAEKWGQQYE
ncbi:MAG: nitroreductase family protein [Bacillota bacterium]